MSYQLVVEPFAEAQLSALPAQLANMIQQQLQRLAANPVVVSKRTALLQPNGQLFEFHEAAGGISVWVSVIFRYGQDEQTLHVEHIAVEFA
jgi:hypothetical protein